METIVSEREREWKFEAPIGAPLPDLRPLVGRVVTQPAQRLRTAYFDSVDRRLSDRGLSLRHRITDDGEPGVWTLKTPERSDGWLERDELSWAGPRDAVPPAVERIVRGILRREHLHQLVELDTTRQRRVLRDDGDAAVAELDDDLVTVSGGPRDGARFRQVELELTDDDWSGTMVVASLEAAGACVESTSKLTLALGPTHEGSGADTLTRRSSLADVLLASLAGGFRRLADHDWRLRLALPEPHRRDVHQARVATRRLRSNLKTFGGVLDPVWVRHTRDDLKWLGAALGEVRDTDVLASGLADLPDDHRRALAAQRAAASRRLVTVLDGERYVQLLDRLHAATTLLPLAGGEAAARAALKARDSSPELVRPRWRALRRQARKARRDPSPERLHQVRIKAKQVRYGAEAAAPVVGKDAQRLATAAERLQTELGEHHDAVAAEEWLRARANDNGRAVYPPGLAFDTGFLAATARRRRERYERRWTRSWKRLSKPELVRWLH